MARRLLLEIMPKAPPRPPPFASLADLVESLARERPEAPALRIGSRGWTRAEAAGAALRLAGGWRAEGFERGDVVAVVAEGGVPFALALLSASRAGLATLVVDPRSSPEEAALACERARAKAWVPCGSVALAAPPGIRTFPFDESGCPALATGESATAASCDPGAPAILLATSGTSGRARVVALTAANLLADLEGAFEVHPAAPDDVFLSLLPVSHAFGLVPGFLGPLWIGASVVFPTARNPHRLLDLAREERVTQVFVVPALLRMMAEEIRDAADGRRLLDEIRTRLRSIFCGGAPLAPDLAREIVSAGLPLWIGYGLTETSPIVTLGPAAGSPPGSCGRPIPGIEVRVDPESGEVLVRGPIVMRGYAGDAEATAAALRDGWLHTGDRGRLDAEGHLFLEGRLGEIIVTAGGEKLSPEEIEGAYRSDLFAEICVVGLPDPERGGGEFPVLVAVPRDGKDDRALREEYVRLSIRAGRRRAKQLVVRREPLPRTRTGKVRRDLVRQRLLLAAR
jgi:long-chain acyl-CoA synthetase